MRCFYVYKQYTQVLHDHLVYLLFVKVEHDPDANNLPYWEIQRVVGEGRPIVLARGTNEDTLSMIHTQLEDDAKETLTRAARGAWPPTRPAKGG